MTSFTSGFFARSEEWIKNNPIKTNIITATSGFSIGFAIAEWICANAKPGFHPANNIGYPALTGLVVAAFMLFLFFQHTTQTPQREVSPFSQT